MIIGDRGYFAVEYSFADGYPNDMGYGRIWVKNKFIGTYKDLIFLAGYLLKTLNEFKESKDLDDDLKHLSKEQLFHLFCTDENGSFRKYLIRGATFTDDFSIWTYRLNGLTYFLWKVTRTDFFEDLNDYDQNVFLESILTDKLDEVINKLKTEIKTRESSKGDEMFPRQHL